jgi:hypothetical protein
MRAMQAATVIERRFQWSRIRHELATDGVMDEQEGEWNRGRHVGKGRKLMTGRVQ